MAYRQLLALSSVVIGLAALGCGSGNSNVASDPPDDGAALPAPADQPPFSADQPPASSDRPPASSDQPAGGPAPGGGGGSGAQAACRDLCDGVGDNCPGNGPNAAVRAICETGCVLDAQTNRCEREVLALITCLAGLDGLCTEDGPSEQAAARCNDDLQAAGQCTDDAEPPASSGACKMASGCADCANVVTLPCAGSVPRVI